tara:strand:+ start:9289 stop:11532 length:2244 start_codon:yes stop_codon:yes gene_type:complete
MKLFKGIFFLVFFIFLLSNHVYAKILITEVMANPLEDENLNEYIEIYNNGTQNINVSNWIIGDNTDNDTIEGGLYGGSGTIIPPKSYALITDETTRVYNNFNVSEDAIRLYIDDASIGYGGLGNTADYIYLRNNTGNLIDNFNYSSTTEGLSWIRIGNNWIEEQPTSGNNGTVSAETIENNLCNWQIKITSDKSFYENNTEVEWEVEAYKLEGTKANLSVTGYVKKVNGDIIKEYHPWTNTSITSKRTRTYSPNLENNIYLLEYNITHLSCNDTDPSNNHFSKLIVIGFQQSSSEQDIIQNTTYSALKITELLPNPEGDDRESEWLELYNSGNTDLDLKGLKLKDNSNRNIIISDVNTAGNTIITSNSYKIIHTGSVYGFLNNEGLEEISLYHENSLINKISYSDSNEGDSWSLFKDNWQLGIPSPNSENTNNNSGKTSTFTIEKIYDLGRYNKSKFGQTIRAKVNIWKGDDSKNSISLWVEDKKGHRISKYSKTSISTKYINYELALPVQIYPNCNENYEDGNYTLNIGWTSGYEIKDSYKFNIKGISNDVCVGENRPKQESAKKFIYELVSAPKEIEIGKEFETKVKLTNNDNKLHKIEIWSYIYRGSKSYSGEREENKKLLTIPKNNEIIETLKNKVKAAKPGDYKLRIMIIKDNQKTPYILTEDISIIGPSKENKTISTKLTGKAALNIIDQPLESQKTNLQPRTQPGLIYESTSSTSGKLIPYIVIFTSITLNIILISKRLQ